MNYTWASQTDVGRVRAHNEDAVLLDAENHMALLADGMGGCNAGEIASAMAVDTVARELRHWLQQAGEQTSTDAGQRAWQAAIQSAVDAANTGIYQAALANPAYKGMGTTLVLAVFRDGALFLGHVGDSRCYRLRAGSLVQLTRDHSVIQQRLDAGLVTPEQARQSGLRHLLTRALGTQRLAGLEQQAFAVAAGDLYMLCSDGLTDMLDDATIAAILCQPQALNHPEHLMYLARALVQAANAVGGVDNISVVLAQATMAIPVQTPVVEQA